MTVQIYDWRNALREVRDEWSSLIATGKYNPSLHPDWLDATLTAWSLDGAASVAVVRADGGTLAFVPFLLLRRRVFGLPIRCLEPCSNVFSYHAEVACSGDAASALRELLTFRGLPSWDAFHVVNVPSEGPTARAMAALEAELSAGWSNRIGERSPYVTIEGGWQRFLTTRSKKVRANITRSQRLMKEAGETGMTWYERGSDWRPLLDAMLEIESRSWKLGAGVAILAGTPQSRYYERLLPWLCANGIQANVLYVKEKPVAYVLCAVWQGWVGQLKTSFVEELRDAGSRVVDASLERAFSNGYGEYDFLGDAAPHKLKWTDSVRGHADLWMFARHLRGRAAAGAKALADRVHRARAAPARDSAEYVEA